MGEPAFRARQLWQWVWQKGVFDFEAMTDMSKPFRARLKRKFEITLPTVTDTQIASDGTVKLLLALADGRLVETVLIPEEDRLTQCLSTQVGCPLRCSFCSTGAMGLERNLTSGEILGQVLAGRQHLARTETGKQIKNLVFMGMGEPLLNWDNVHAALLTLNHPLGLDFSTRRITVSTVGVPGMLGRLGASGLASLAVSLHAPTQELRARIMPRAAALISLEDLIRELKEYPLKPRQRITIEYILLDRINDSLDDARKLVRLLTPLKHKVNLISYNPSPCLPYDAPKPERVLDFERYLWSKGVTAILRKSKGQDISAACGQLKTDHLKNHSAH